MTVTVTFRLYHSDQPRPAHLLIGWLPVTGLPVLPPPTADQGKGGQRQAGGRTGDAGAQRLRGQRLQTSQQRPRRCGSLERPGRAEDRGNCRIYFCTCLQNEHQQSTHPYICCFDISSVFFFLFLVIAGAHFAHHKPNHRANRIPHVLLRLS